MTLLGFSLVLSAAFCHATWNFFIKKLNGGPELVWLFSLVAAILYLPIAIYALANHAGTFDLRDIGFIIGSSVLHLGYFLLLQQGYRHGDLSVVYPTARATGPFLSTLFAVIVLSETMTLQIAIGGAIIIVGVLCLTNRRGQSSNAPAASVLFGLAAGLLIGSYTVWDAHAVATLMIPPLVLDYASSLGRVILLSPIASRRKSEIRRMWQNHRFAVVIIAVFNPLAYILVLYAMTFTPIIYVAPLREVGVLLTVLMDSLLLGEGDLRRRLLWAAVILAGVAILATA